MEEKKIIEWKGWRYSAKPFTPRVYFELSEGIYAQSQSGAYLSGSKRIAIEKLLIPLDDASKTALLTGKLVASLFDEETDSEGAFGVMETLGFLSTDYMERGTKLLSAQKDLGSSLLAKPLTSESPTNTATEPDFSGAAEAT